MRRFLGLINYDRSFVRKLAEKTKPLYETLGKTKFEMSNENISLFNSIKQEWERDLELTVPDRTKAFILETDASETGIGAILKQEGKPIAFISRVLKGSEVNYSITEKEVLAAIWAMERLEYLLLGTEFLLVTDHKAMVEIKKKEQFGSKRIQRWFERLENFTFKVCHRPGTELIGADILSRMAEGEDKIGNIQNGKKIKED